MSQAKERWQKKPKWLRVTGMVVGGIALAVLLGFLFGFVIQLLWNWLMPGIFHLREITYWEAVGLFILARFIFGCSFGSDNNNKEPKHKKKSAKNDWESAKQEFKEEFKKEFDGDCKHWMYYDEWWDEEGQKAFDEYADKRNQKKPMHEDKNEPDSNE